MTEGKGGSEKYLYTKKGEEQARRKGVEPRIAGQPAFFGHAPLHLYETVAKAWSEKGYVVWKEDDKVGGK